VRRDIRRLLLATFVSWIGLRLTEVALPLIALQQTGSVWATGLVAGSSSIAVLTSPWWAARVRHRVTSGPGLAAVLGVQALGYLIVAVAAALDALTVVHLCLGGLLAGAATSVGGPATRALLADIGDRIGPGVAVRALAWQDLAHRISMVASPPVAALVVIQYGAMPLMWADTVAVLVAAAVVARVGQYGCCRETTESVPRRAREVLRAHPMVANGIVMAAVGWFWWFAFALGLAILGFEIGQPGQLIAAGMTGYGIGSLAGSLTAPLVVTRLPRVPPNQSHKNI
jgi:MFS family permease